MTRPSIKVVNPNTNALPSYLDEEAILRSVVSSGYPLQAVVADSMRDRFALQEEWSFFDSDSGELRSLDLLAQRPLYDVAEPNKFRVRPCLSLLLECKQSDLPYVFFFSPTQRTASEFPTIAGLFGDNIKITSDDDMSTWNYPVQYILGMCDTPFISSPPNSSLTFSKCVRKGKDFELSGSEAFLKLVMPLVKATKHFVKAQCPPETAYYHDFHIAIPVGVLDAPMVGVHFSGGSPKIVSVPWVRVFRHESIRTGEDVNRERGYAIDIIHKDFLSDYLCNHVIPFAEQFAKAGECHHVVLASQRGFISGMGKDSWSNLESRLRPQGIMSKTGDAVVKVLAQILKMSK